MNSFLAELVGTMLLIILGDGVVAAVVLNKTKAQNSGWMVITTGWALAVAMGVYASGRISGGHLNPAVTLSMAAIGKFPWSDVPKFLAAQLLGALLGAAVVWLAYLAHWPATEDQSAKFKSLKEATDKALQYLQDNCPADTPVTPTARAAATEQQLQAMLEAVRTVRPALDDLFGSLTDEQKARLSTIAPAKNGGRPVDNPVRPAHTKPVQHHRYPYWWPFRWLFRF